MSTVASEVGALPVTGSGPFTFAIGLLGVAAIAVGAIMRRFARRDETPTLATPAPAGRFDLSADLSAVVSAAVAGQ